MDFFQVGKPLPAPLEPVPRDNGPVVADVRGYARDLRRLAPGAYHPLMAIADQFEWYRHTAWTVSAAFLPYRSDAMARHWIAAVSEWEDAREATS